MDHLFLIDRRACKLPDRSSCPPLRRLQPDTAPLFRLACTDQILQAARHHGSPDGPQLESRIHRQFHTAEADAAVLDAADDPPDLGIILRFLLALGCYSDAFSEWDPLFVIDPVLSADLTDDLSRPRRMVVIEADAMPPVELHVDGR